VPRLEVIDSQKERAPAQLESDAKLAASVARQQTRVAQRRALGVILRFEEGGSWDNLGGSDRPGLMQKPKAALVVPE
jgi:hypothetical protein